MSTFRKLNCHPKHKTKKFTCYDDDTLSMFKNIWNKKYPKNKINSINLIDIWKELQKKIPTCTNELCWADTLNIKKNEYFSPKAPDEWNKNKNEWLSNFDIENVLKQYKETYPNFDYLGPSPIDFDKKLDKNETCVENKLCKLNIEEKIKNKINKIGISINLDTHDKGGSHWVSIFLDLKRNYIFYFDSCGEDMPKEINILIERIEEQCKKLGIKIKRYDSINMHHQTGTTECGMYSLFCIINLLEGKHTVNYFKKHKIPDKDVERYRKIYFN